MPPDPTAAVSSRDMAIDGVFAKHFQAITDALNLAVMSTEYAALRSRYAEARDAVEKLAGTIAKYDTAGHNEPSGVRYVSSSDSAASGDNISGLKG